MLRAKKGYEDTKRSVAIGNDKKDRATDMDMKPNAVYGVVTDVATSQVDMYDYVTL